MQTRARYRCENLLKSQNGLCSAFSKAKYLEGKRPVFQKAETPAYVTHPEVTWSIRTLTVGQSNQRSSKILLMCWRRGAWPIVRSHLLLPVYSRRLRTLMHTAVLALHPQGAAGGADETHETSGTGAAGAARHPGAALLNPTNVQTNVRPGESNDRLQQEGAPARYSALLKLLIVANVADYWGVLLRASHMWGGKTRGR